MFGHRKKEITLKRTMRIKAEQRGIGDIAAPMKRKVREERGEVRKIKPHTPFRKSIKQISDDGVHVQYLHATKGWRTRTIIEPHISAFWSAINRAQIHQMNKRALKL